MTKFIRVPKKPDPFQSEIDRRLAARKGKESVRQVSAPVVGPGALRALAAAIRESLTVRREVR